MTAPEGKKECTVTFACSPELKSRLTSIARYLSYEKGNDISFTQLAHKYVRDGIQREFNRLCGQRHDLDSFLKDLSSII